VVVVVVVKEWEWCDIVPSSRAGRKERGYERGVQLWNENQKERRDDNSG